MFRLPVLANALHVDLQVTNNTALITGASAGIGRGIAKALAVESVTTVIAARRQEALNELATEIENSGHPLPIVISSDLYEDNASNRFAEAVLAAVGHIDILINNAGGNQIMNFLWDAMASRMISRHSRPFYHHRWQAI